MDAGNVQLTLKRKLKALQDGIFICKTLHVFTASGKKSKKKKQSKHPLYWNCIVTHCPFCADEYLLWTESIMSNLSLSHFLKGMYLFSSIPSAWGWEPSQEPWSHTAQQSQPLGWQNRGISAGFSYRVAFVPVPEASLLAREKQIWIGSPDCSCPPLGSFRAVPRDYIKWKREVALLV